MRDLTPRQQKFMVFVQAYVERHGISPSYDEIRIALSLKSKHTVANLVDSLAWAGRLTRSYQHARSIKLLPTEDHHAPDCECLGCCHRRYLKRLKLVEALDVPVEITPGIVLVGLRTLDYARRDSHISWPRLKCCSQSSMKRSYVHSVPHSSKSGTTKGQRT